MRASEIDELLLMNEIIFDSVTWRKLENCVDNAVEEYEGVVCGRKIFLHLLSYETTNYWLITYPHKSMNSTGQTILLFHYELNVIISLMLVSVKKLET